MSKHTEGPWMLSFGTIHDKKGQVIAFIEDRGDCVPSESEREANAALIAAAPELLDMLRELVQAAYDEVPPEDDMEEIWTDLYAACGKAERLIAKADEVRMVNALLAECEGS